MSLGSMANKGKQLTKVQVFELFCSEEFGIVTGISLVDEPAIDLDWLAFAKANFHPNCRCVIKDDKVILAKDACKLCKDAKKAYNAAKRNRGGRLPKGIEWVSPDDLNFSEDKDKMILTGPLMVPDLRIPRVAEDGTRFDVFFSEATVREMAKAYALKTSNKALNEDHSDKVVPGFLFESWIVEDPMSDKSHKLGYRVPKGTWMGSVQVTDPEYWKTSIKEGKLKGFSIEVESPKSKLKMTKQLSFIKLDDGRELNGVEGAETLNVGDEAFLMLEDGTSEVAPDGDYPAGDVVIKVEAGRVAEIETIANEDNDFEETVVVADEKTDVQMLEEKLVAMLADFETRLNAIEAAAAKSNEDLEAAKEAFAKVKSTTSKSVSVKLEKREKFSKTETAVKGFSLAAAEAAAAWRSNQPGE